uniref:Serine/threonine-protein kinase ATG1c isoform X1 n=2 Tax=Elaeis guineensis var. tenera TaxID=51953 RepID=A0A6I9S5Q0_ELAGV|nr:serine/threonine-protein kinase ATG1c isoform X1 [Elaeis guineensis]
MASPSSRGGGGRVVGEYMIGRRIGSGAFSEVWLGRHRVRGTEVAVKEIVMERMSKKLQESLLSEVFFLRKINHPNVIALHDFIQASGRIYLILEYCRGGDLSKYIQRHGRVLEATAKNFMRQLAAGLQVLRENNVVHRDLKPQNLLLSTSDGNSVLKIADFGFARSLQPRGLAETLCGSPLYMAPEVMQCQKYDAKADLWSVGVILFQLITGKTPFDGNSHPQLLQNIGKANVLHLLSDSNLSHDCIDLCQKLLRRNPVERLTFEEFFNHRFLLEHPLDERLRRTSCNVRDDTPLVECNPTRPSGESSQEDCLPFPLDDESSGQDGSPSLAMKKSSVRTTYGFSVDIRLDNNVARSTSKNIDIVSGYNSTNSLEAAGYRHDSHRTPGGNANDTKLTMEQRPSNVSSKDSTTIDSLEFADHDYVLVPEPPLEMSSSPVSASQSRNSPCKSESSPIASPEFSALSAPMPIIGAAINKTRAIGSLESHSSPASETSQGSMDMGDAMEQPSAHCLTRIRSLQRCASVITELVKDKIENGRRLEAFAVQLVVLAIWKQALHICHAQAASAMEGSPSPETRTRESNKDASNTGEYISCIGSKLPVAVCLLIEKEFLLEVGHAEELAVDFGQIAETTEMPDAIEIIFQSALAFGRHGAVDEMMGNTGKASSQYSKAVCLLYFLLVEAPSLALSPPFSPTNSDRYRLRSYFDVLNSRQGRSLSQRMALKCDDE